MLEMLKKIKSKKTLKKAVLFISLVGVSVFMCCCTKKKPDKTSNEIVFGVQQDFDNLDPHLAEAAGTREVLFNVYEGLVKVTADGNLVDALAESHTISDDGKTYGFKIRQGVKFHDGSELTPEDVKYSIERNAGLIEGQPVLDAAFANISEVNIKSENEIEIVLKESDTEFLSYLTEAIIPKTEKSGGVAPSGTGPFYIESYVPGEKLVIKKNENYWNKEKAAYLDRVTFKIVTAQVAVIELKAGSIDMYPYLTNDQAEELKNDFDILTGNSNLVQAVFLNNSKEVFSDVRIRQALNYAIDKQEILDIVAGGKGNILGSALYSGFGRYYNDELTNYYTYDVEKAKSLVKEVLGDEKLSFTVRVPSNYEVHMSTALVIQDQLKKADIEMKIDAIDWNTWLTEVYSQQNYEATIVGVDSKLAPKDMMRRYATGVSGNFTFFSNSEYDALYAEAIATVDDGKKIELYKKMQEIVTKEAASVFIQDNASLMAVSRKLTGYTFYPMYVQDMSLVRFK